MQREHDALATGEQLLPKRVILPGMGKKLIGHRKLQEGQEYPIVQQLHQGKIVRHHIA